MLPHYVTIRCDLKIALLMGACILACIVHPSMCSAQSSTAETVARWDFGTNEDAKRDRWPDGWTRRRGSQYPTFIPIQIEQRSVDENEAAEIDQFRRTLAQLSLAWQQKRMPWQVIPESIPSWIDRMLEQSVVNPYLSVRMDGGAAEALSPFIAVDSQSVYRLDVAVHSEPCEFVASAHLRFLDRNKKVLFETSTPIVEGANEWKTVETSLQYPDNNNVAFVQVVLRVNPKSNKAYTGKFGFDRVQVTRLPRLRLSVDRALRLYRQGEPVQVTCKASGMNNEHSFLLLSVYDHNGKKVASIEKEFDRVGDATAVIAPKRDVRRMTQSSNSQLIALKPDASNYFEGKCDWVLNNLPPGYYDLRTKLTQGKSSIFELNQQFAVIGNTQRELVDPRFGWTLDEIAHSLDSDLLLEVVRESRVGRVKLPIWFDYRNPVAQDSYVRLVDRLQTSGINCVGIVARPPESLRDQFANKDISGTATSLDDPVVWNALLDPVFRLMCVRMVDFQIGWDNEVDFAGNPRFATAIDSLRKVIHRYGPDSQLIAARNPLTDSFAKAPVDRWQLSNEIEFAVNEWVTRQPTSAALPTTKMLPWTSITPIQASKYSLSTRVQDLTSRMISSTRSTANQQTTAWVSRPFDPEVGLLAMDGGPQELYVPFRSLADALAGLKWVGSMELPNKSTNHLVVSDVKSRLILWTAQPTNESFEQLFLGTDVTGVDVWGRAVKITNVDTPYGREQRVPVSRWPVILDRVDQYVARWRMGIEVKEHRLDTIIGKEQEVVVKFDNPFPMPVTGRIELVAPDLFAEGGSASSFEVDANDTTDVPINVILKPDASTKNAVARIVVSVNAQKPYQFSLNKELNIGSGDVEFDIQYHFEPDDELWLELEAINHGESAVNFDCMLMMADRPRERIQIVNIKERSSRTVSVPRASDLIGQTIWLRCEQIGSGRILNYRINIDPPTDDAPSTP